MRSRNRLRSKCRQSNPTSGETVYFRRFWTSGMFSQLWTSGVFVDFGPPVFLVNFDLRRFRRFWTLNTHRCADVYAVQGAAGFQRACASGEIVPLFCGEDNCMRARQSPSSRNIFAGIRTGICPNGRKCKKIPI